MTLNHGKPRPILRGACRPALLVAWLVTAGDALADDFVDRILPFVESHCLDCHDGDAGKAEGEVDLFPYASTADLLEAPGLWERVHRVIVEGEMPPAERKKQPATEARERVASWIDSTLQTYAEEHAGDPGHVVMPRLTNLEYRNVIRDLSGGVVTEAGKYLPNEGGAGEGFANVGEAQSVTSLQLERFITAAKLALRHARVFPGEGLVWNPIPREPVDTPAAARFELINDIVQWHGRQQMFWGREYLDELEAAHGMSHGLYFEGAWRYFHRVALGNPEASLASVALDFDPELNPLILEKWWALLRQGEPDDITERFIAQWAGLPHPRDLGDRSIRQLCGALETWSVPAEPADWSPDYELSFLPSGSKDLTLRAAKEGRFPFRIEVGDAKELFLVLTDFDDGNLDDWGVWRKGEFVRADRSAVPWEEHVEVIDLETGEPIPWGHHPKDLDAQGPTSVGLQAPGILKIVVPEGTVEFNVEFLLTDMNARLSSVQTMVLKELPDRKFRRRYPNRVVFGKADSRIIKEMGDNFDSFLRTIRFRNVPGSNQTKVGLNAERNIFFDWTGPGIRLIGGPWDEQKLETPRPLVPYYFTAPEARRVASPEQHARRQQLEQRLLAVIQASHQELYQALRAAGFEDPKEGVLPSSLPERLSGPADRVQEAERVLLSDARRCVRQFATRAWRRPLSRDELRSLLGLYEESRRQGFSFDSSVKSSLLAVLAAPDFLFRATRGSSSFSVHDASSAEQSDQAAEARKVVPLNDYELASRLSFFLWASIPDRHLLRLAAEGKLRDPKELRRQVRRMLNDDRAFSLATQFAGQLYQFADFESFQGPDQERFQEFTPALRKAMFDEVTLVLADIFQRDAPLTGLIARDSTYATPALAELYGVPATSNQGPGSNPIRIALPEERGGLAGMALFLTNTSLPLRTSAVQRGTWVYEQLLGRHMPSPPADVPAISEDERDGAGATVREQLEIHRADAGCASCHDKIDPLGIALENFDPIGRWRTTDRGGGLLATSAESHDGVFLDGPIGLRQYLETHRDEVFRHFNRKLLGYALGRAVILSDRPLLDRMTSSLEEQEFRFSWLVEQIVSSPQFLHRRGGEMVAKRGRNPDSERY